MIKVIASDMDGTLLGDDHMVAPRTLDAIHKACDAGIRFMIATGRNFDGAMAQVGELDLTCDYIVGSGAEVRTPEQKVIQQYPMSMECCREIYEAMQEYPLSMIFCTDKYDYRIGTKEEAEESVLLQLKLFHLGADAETIKKMPLYQRVLEKSRQCPDLDELEKSGVPIYKLFLFAEDLEMLEEIKKKLEKNPEVAVASSFESNLEITDVKAQKGPVLKAYIESLGYKMEEVMALGDSLNDYSMLSMDFGATVAMENAVPEVKAAAKYITKSNEEYGVAYAIEELLKRQGKGGSDNGC